LEEEGRRPSWRSQRRPAHRRLPTTAATLSDLGLTKARPIQAEVQQLADKLDELMDALRSA
jgi:hypothetical protein